MTNLVTPTMVYVERPYRKVATMREKRSDSGSEDYAGKEQSETRLETLKSRKTKHALAQKELETKVRNEPRTGDGDEDPKLLNQESGATANAMRA